jgi:hypothetical protein
MDYTTEVLRERGGTLALALLLSAVLLTTACNKDSDGDGKPTDGKDQVAAIEPIEGMKYYVGGPIMGLDDYGRTRMVGFNGEIKNPTSRGLLVGFKELPNNEYDFRTWLNGGLLQTTTGVRDKGGRFWHRERITYNFKGQMTVRQLLEYDDDKQLIHSTIEHIDPENGEVLQVVKTEQPYAPPDAGDVDIDIDTDGEDAEDDDASE